MSMPISPIAAGSPAPKPDPQVIEAKLWKAAQSLEASFLSEMLKAAGFGEARDSFGGGYGEEHFGSFMRDAQAKAMVEAGGIGLAQSIFDALKERADV